MGHIDAHLLIEELWGEKTIYTGDRHPEKDGWPVFRTQYHVATFHQDVRVHSYMGDCEPEAYGGHAIELTAGQLLKLAKLLRKFATDPNAMADYEDLMTKADGWEPGTEGYHADRKLRMEGATKLAKKIRRAAKYIRKREKERGPGDHSRAWVHAVYKASV